MALAMALCLGLGTVSLASTPIPNYFLHLWRTEDGLPQNAVTAIVQTQDGYLWLGTYSGLARFDGVRFARFDNDNTPQMRSVRVTSLFEDGAGSLWVGYESGDVTRYQQGRFQAVDLPPAWNGRKILALSADETGDIWALGAYGSLARLRDGFIIPSDPGGAEEVASLTRDTSGRIWIMRNGRLWRLQGTQLAPAQFDSEAPTASAQGICASKDGGVWFANGGRLRKWRRGGQIEDQGPVPWGTGPTAALLETQAGALAAATVDRGLSLTSPGGGGWFFNRTNGLPSDWVRALCEDREGNLWVGTGNGLVALRAGKVATFNAPDQWQGRAVLSVMAAQGGGLWIGTEGAGIYRLDQDHWTRFSDLQNTFVWSVCEDAQGRLWAGTWGGGLFVQRGGRFERPEGLEDITVPMLALLRAADGTIWAGTGTGLMHYAAGQTTWYGAKEGLSFPDVRAVAQDNQGAIWFGMFGGGLGCLKEGALRQFRKRDGLSSDFVQCLRADEDSSLWIGTFGGGLNRLKQGHFAVINTSNGLNNNIICDIEEDAHGNFWMSSHAGVMRVTKQEMNRCADGLLPAVKCVALDKGDGLPTLDCSGGLQPAGCKTADGVLWFPTSRGLVAVDPTQVKPNLHPPPVVIEELLVDGKSVGLLPSPTVPSLASLRIRPGQNQFEFRYTGLSFVAPEKIRFQYRLEGLDTDWAETEKRAVTYAHIPPGNYAFHVKACNNDGIWNDDGAAVAFELLPRFWQTWWFRSLAGAAILAAASGLVWFDTQRRMRRKLERAERQRAIEHERARIARDIHDDLGSNLTRITMLSESARGDLANPVQAGADIERIYDTARELTRAMDEIVWAVNPKHDTIEGLINYLEKYAQDFLATAGLRCRLDVPLQFPAWSLTSEVRHNLFLAFKEALNNVVKHARASEARISLALEADALSLSVEDDGRGFSLAGDAAAAAPDRLAQGNGLENMRRRLEEIGGHCDFRTAPGSGTRVTFAVPVNAPVP